jgi:glycosyltransferase involved in cell wall biosynthesis
MRLYWYWPFSREENEPLACSVSRHPEVERLAVSTIERPGAWPEHDDGRLGVRHDLAPVGAEGGLARWIDRPRVHAQRVVSRRRAVSLERPDLVHVWYSSPWADPVDLRVRRGPRTVLHVHDVWPHERLGPPRVTRALLGSMYSAPDALVVYHESLRDLLVEDFAISRDRIHLVPLVVPPPAVGAVEEAEQGTDQVVVLCFGTFRRNKGLDVLVDAIDRLGPDGGIRWIIAGKGDPDLERFVIDAAATRPQLDAIVRWHTAAEKSALYHRADLVVQPYTSFASQSAVLHDAYGHGRPVVAADVGALGPTVRNDATGWVVPPGDAAALAAAVASAAGDAPGRAARAAAARAEADRRSPDAVTAALVDVYHEVLAP